MNAPLVHAVGAVESRSLRRPYAWAYWFAVAAFALVLAGPFALVDVPPVLDYPNHLARMFVLAHPDDPILSQMYAVQWRILPNLGMDAIGALLLRVTDVHIGGRLLLMLSLFAPIIGVLVYHRSLFGRLSYWPLASALIAYNGVFFLGFMNFLLGLGTALLFAAGWIALRRRKLLLASVIAGALGSAVTFLCHIFGAAFFALLIGAYETDRLWRLRNVPGFSREFAATAAALAASLAPALLLYLLSPLNDESASLGRWNGVAKIWRILTPVSYTHLTLPTNREV